MSTGEDVARLRREYRRAALSESTVDPDPIVQFGAWLDAALAACVADPTATTLATASVGGAPSARVVLLKGYDRRGFTFYTNYESDKGRDLAENPRAAMVFYWPELERQVRVGGNVERLSTEESARYFHSRPRGSQLGAWASRQSRVIRGREELDARLADAERHFAGATVPLPPYWGGFRVMPQTIEFWQGRPNRLHDRLRYQRDTQGVWRRERLSP